MEDCREIVWKVTVVKGSVETVYLTTAPTRLSAQADVLDELYERNFFRKADPAKLANDPFGLVAAGQHGSWTDAKLKKDHGISISAIPYSTGPYRLYAIDTSTGEMT